MIVINSREFRENQKKYFDLVDQNERVVIKRKDKSYELTSKIKNDRFFDDPKIKERIEKSLKSLEEGKGVKLSDQELKDLFGL
ncbi:type II toxin-antitoxin system Phd/YefM family antitoxin [Belliella sp. DSM 107340]|uniref:Type II toxin-antitoxin system Phd/YefM family antitoxin n=1 Tax=Belliella calami TaxID=2923436 RepID=A0ABS9UNB9_9BACT|nr:type II toxin-antitoxin system Phd/YefM family antitoxin [Belliella calami]MCH7397854.1 type II toxin-antitoxin system Phd/YefM family antitoxin [Belliella calami]